MHAYYDTTRVLAVRDIEEGEAPYTCPLCLPRLLTIPPTLPS